MLALKITRLEAVGRTVTPGPIVFLPREVYRVPARNESFNKPIRSSALKCHPRPYQSP